MSVDAASAASLLAGAGIVAATAADIFQTVIVPRRTGRFLRTSATIGRRAWVAWRFVADHLTDEIRTAWLGAYAPLLLVALFGFWLTSIVIGYGLIFFALRHAVRPVPGLFEAIYYAGATTLTFGYGDFVPVAAPTRVTALLAGASGLSGIAVVAAYLFPLFAAYQSREIAVSVTSNRAGRPPSMGELLRLRTSHSSSDAFVAALRDAELWLAQLLETHLAYPVLLWFRPSDEFVSWLAVVETLLDTTALLLAAVDDSALGEAVLVQRIGVRLLDELQLFLRLPPCGRRVAIAEFDSGYDALAATGTPLRERAIAGEAFLRARSRYAGRIDAMARYWRLARTLSPDGSPDDG